MADFKRGIIAGITTGIIYVAIFATVAATDHEFLDISGYMRSWTHAVYVRG